MNHLPNYVGKYKTVFEEGYRAGLDDARADAERHLAGPIEFVLDRTMEEWRVLNRALETWRITTREKQPND